VELILRGVDSRRGSEGQDSDQPDYDSVASDEDPEREAVTRDDEDGADRRTKVPNGWKFGTFCRSLENRFLILLIHFDVDTELRVVRPLRRADHGAGVPGGEERAERLRGEDPAAPEAQLSPERGAPHDAGQGGRGLGWDTPG